LSTMPCVFSISLDPARFDALAEVLAVRHQADLFLSSPGYPGETRSFIGVAPCAELIIEEDTGSEKIKEFAFGPGGPCMGFLSYTYGMSLRGVNSEKKTEFPYGHLKKYRAVVKYDAASEGLHLSGEEKLCREIIQYIELIDNYLNKELKFKPMCSEPEVSLGRAAYEAGVAEILERIRDGWTYQLNLSTRLTWQSHDLDPLALFLELRRDYPAPFYGYVRSGAYGVVSSSPERFIQIKDGQVLSQPIKGTARVVGDESEAYRSLVDSSKECAELSMIVDLIRNDVSANCEYGSVRVEGHKFVFRVDDLLQMYANVRGTLRSDRDCVDLLLDAFPGGSVTGCPKQSSMRIIEELEPHTRDVFCGSLLIIEDERNMDSSIAIRTAVYDDSSGQLDYWAGSGIVIASDPGLEYLETMAKAGKFLQSESK